MGGYDMPIKKTQEEFVQEVFGLVGEEYSVVGEYLGSSKKVEIEHHNCENRFSIRANAFLAGQRCSSCYKPVKKTQKQFISEVFERVGDEYTILGDYGGNKTKVLVIHNTCGFEYEVTPGHFLYNGRRCPKCNGGVRRGNYDFEKHVSEYGNGEYVPLTKYISTKKHVLMKHTLCDHTWNIKPENFFYGKGCPICRESLGERQIRKILTENRIPFQSQYKFRDCIHKRSLPFDFAILKSGEVIALVEFHGEQHFRKVEFFGGEKGFYERTRNDGLKSNYCQDNNLPLLIIKYNDEVERNLLDFVEHYADPEPSAQEIV